MELRVVDPAIATLLPYPVAYKSQTLLSRVTLRLMPSLDHLATLLACHAHSADY